MELRLNLLDLAFQIARKDEIEKNIKQIEEIEGGDGLMGPYCQALYLSWQAAQRAGDSDTREALRTKARELLNELMPRRPEWSLHSHCPRPTGGARTRPRRSEGRREAGKSRKASSVFTFRQSNLVIVPRLFCAGRCSF